MPVYITNLFDKKIQKISYQNWMHNEQIISHKMI